MQDKYETSARFLPHGVEVTQQHKESGVKSTKIVDYNSFFEAVNKNIVLQTGLLPLGCRDFSRADGHVIAMLEEPPRIENMEFHNRRSEGENIYKAKLPMPGILIGVKLQEGRGVTQASVWALKTPIKDLDDILYNCPLGNTYAGRGSGSGNFCWGNTTGIWKDIKHVHQLRSMVNIFYTSRFNSDLSPCFNIPASMADENIKSVLDLWKYLNGKKEFPTEILMEACTFKTAIQGMEGRKVRRNDDIPF